MQNIIESADDWSSWKVTYKKQISHVAGYEEEFVDSVLSKISGVSPKDVIPQFHFLDDEGGNRYIDFMILNEAKGYCLPIELDGTYKDLDHYRWKDFLSRQNSLITKFGIVLRFSNKQMRWESSSIIDKINHTLKSQSENKITEEEKARERDDLNKWYLNKIDELVKENKINKEIEVEMNQLRSLVEEVRLHPPKETNKKKITQLSRVRFNYIFFVVATCLVFFVFVSLSDGFSQGDFKQVTTINEYESKEEINQEGKLEKKANDIVPPVNEVSRDNKTASFTDDINTWSEVSVDDVQKANAKFKVNGDIAPSKAMQYLGKEIVVCGRIKNIITFSKGVYLYFETLPSESELRAVIWDSDFDTIMSKYEGVNAFLQRDVCISGKITIFNDKLQVIVKSVKEVEVVE